MMEPLRSSAGAGRRPGGGARGAASRGPALLIHTDMETPERDARGFVGWWYVTPPDHCCFFRHRTFEAALAPTPHRVVWRDPKRVLIEVGAQPS